MYDCLIVRIDVSLNSSSEGCLSFLEACLNNHFFATDCGSKIQKLMYHHKD